MPKEKTTCHPCGCKYKRWAANTFNGITIEVKIFEHQAIKSQYLTAHLLNVINEEHHDNPKQDQCNVTTGGKV